MRALILTGPSGSGKTTIAQRLVETSPRFVLSLSATTRQPRPGEVHGRDYYFVSEAEFEARVAAGDFLEWESLYSGYRYGTLWQAVEEPLRSGRIPVLVKDVRGTRTLMQALGEDTFSVFILPPSIEAIEMRLRQRGGLREEDLQNRLTAAAREIQEAPHFSAILYNEDIERAMARLLYHIQQWT